MDKTRGFRAWMIVLAAASSWGCASFRHAGDPWWGDDKAKHFVVCGLAGAAAAGLARQADGSDGQAFGIGLGVALGLGAGKETCDARIKGTYFSGKDLVWDLLGGAVGSGLAIGLAE